MTPPRALAALMALLLLAACGVDGEPERPEPRPGVTVTGTIGMGIAGRN